MPEAFGHVFDAPQSLPIRGVFYTPRTLVPHPSPERTFSGVFCLADWGDSSEDFTCSLAELGLRRHEMFVNGECWPQDTMWNGYYFRWCEH